ncbi:MAG: hypothetical protein ACKO6L_06980 [Flavobacteriales bacterium]
MIRRFLFCILICFACSCDAAAQRPPVNQRTVQDGPNLDGVVEVSFKINAEGKVQILDLNSTSQQLSDYVLKKLSTVKLEPGDSQHGKVIRYRFVFKKQA